MSDHGTVVHDPRVELGLGHPIGRMADSATARVWLSLDVSAVVGKQVRIWQVAEAVGGDAIVSWSAASPWRSGHARLNQQSIIFEGLVPEQSTLLSGDAVFVIRPIGSWTVTDLTLNFRYEAELLQ